jgi:hypothetical protein
VQLFNAFVFHILKFLLAWFQEHSIRYFRPVLVEWVLSLHG